jgi:S-(hydroxymethyl)glutathione dehydrogenase/alcohol dehydrogenase
MKAALLTALNAPLEVCDVDLTPLAFGQVQVRVLAAGICGAQLQEIRGEKGGPLPHLMGHEGCGIVEAIGAGVTRVKIGDKVVMHWRKAAGIESPFPNYRVNDREFTSGLVTTWAEQTICSENRLTPVPASTDTTIAVMLGCALSTAIATLESEVRRLGERILVIGCGGLGTSLMGAMHLASPRHVCVCDVHEKKRRYAEINADRYVNLATETLDGAYDLILDTAGVPSTMEIALPLLAPSGRYVMIGQPPPGRPVCINAARHMFDGEGKTITATQGGGFKPDQDIPRYLALSGDLFVHNLVTHTFPLEKINHALDLVRQGESGRVMIEMA